MHPRILAARNQAALEAIADSARRIAVNLGMSPNAIFEGTWVRDADCRALYEREAISKFLVTAAEAMEPGSPKLATMTVKVEAEEALVALRAEVERLRVEAEAAECTHPWSELRWVAESANLVCGGCETSLDPLPWSEPTETDESSDDGQDAQIEQPAGSTDDEEPPSQNLELWAQLAPNAREALEGVGITSAAEVAGMTDVELRAINGIGAKTLAGIREVIPAFTQE